MQELSNSSGASLKTSQSPGTEPGTESPVLLSGRYDPDIYKCVDFDKDYVYFDGRPGSDHDQRFTIDLEHGTMDRLPDVRPYLYYVGYHSSRTLNLQGQIESLAPSEVEQAYVVAGRQYLMNERKRGRGYFLKARNWGSLNTGSYTCFPFERLVGSDNEDDQGFEFAHDISEYEDDCCLSVIKTNVRTPLPPKDLVWVRPGDDKWDLFIQWVYRPGSHGAMNMVESRWAGWEIERERRAKGFGHGWMRPVMTEDDA